MDRAWEEHVTELRRRKAEAQGQGGPEALARLHGRGKLSARERLALLLDRESFHELGLLVEGLVETPGRGRQTVRSDGVVSGWGEIGGRRVFVTADDGSLMGGAAGLANIEKRFRIRRMAIEQGQPFIGLYEGSAIRFQDSMDAGIMARVPAFKEVVDSAGAVPQVAAMLGPCFGRPPIDALFSELVLMVRGTGFIGWSGPSLVKGGMGETVELEDLGGAEMHARVTGLADHVAETEKDCLDAIKTFLTFMPSSCWELPPRAATTDDPSRLCPELLDIVPSNLRKPYDMCRMITALVDNGNYFAYKPEFGKGLITCLARRSTSRLHVSATTLGRVPPRSTPTLTVTPGQRPLRACRASVLWAASSVALRPCSGSTPACAARPVTVRRKSAMPLRALTMSPLARADSSTSR